MLLDIGIEAGSNSFGKQHQANKTEARFGFRFCFCASLFIFLVQFLAGGVGRRLVLFSSFLALCRVQKKATANGGFQRLRHNCFY
ncbi:hypothetical protein [Herbaspirillum sp. RV1423]|uniref:hypothetical protein n=1 Tax=Herbaspirillum sp. RV1423 TaxID=1443993 RepID=UPI0012DBFEE5|nr:hypothetical protein [Herbaspirillum sp. RV1423]